MLETTLRQGLIGLRRQRLISPLCIALCAAIVLFGGVGVVNAFPIAVTSGLPDSVYVENDGEIYVADFSSVRDNAVLFSSGEGSFTITVNRLLFPDSLPNRGVVLEDPLHDFALLGSEPGFVEFLVGVDPRSAVGSEQLVELTFTRASGVTSIDVVVGRDSVRLALPERMLDPGRRESRGLTATFQVNGEVSEVAATDFWKLVGIAEGKRPVESMDSAPQFETIGARLHDPSAFARALIGFGLLTHEIRTAQPNDGDCAGDCLFCGISLGATTGSLVAVALTGCGAIIGCLLWGFSYSGSLAGSGYSCAECIDCLTEPSDPILCPPCDGVEIPCAPGCCVITECPPPLILDPQICSCTCGVSCPPGQTLDVSTCTCVDISGGDGCDELIC